VARTTKKPATTKTKAKKPAVQKAKSTPKRRKSTPAKLLEITPEERWRLIAVAAYYKAEKRDFAPGREVDDWLESEREVDELLGRR